MEWPACPRMGAGIAPGAQTVRPGVPRPARDLLGGRSSPAARLHRGRRAYAGPARKERNHLPLLLAVPWRARNRGDSEEVSSSLVEQSFHLMP
jgi:hypothetical protein